MKTDQVKNGNITITYSIDFGKRKHLYIVVKNGEVIVRVPLRTSKEYIRKAVLDKQNWIIEKIAVSTKKIQPVHQYKEEEEFYLLGEVYKLHLIFKNIKSIKVEACNHMLYVMLPIRYKEEDYSEIIKKKIDQYYKEIAIREISLSLDRIKKQTNLSPNKVTIRKLSSSWGRCSSNGNISMNIELVKYNREVIDYVMLHEICHLKYMNHSKLFWEMVSYYMPDYKEKIEDLENRR